MLLLGGLIFRMPFWMLMLFFVGVFLIYIGMFAFSIGIDMSIVKMGEVIGSELTKSRKIGIILVCGFVLGFVVTIAEPDLQVLASQTPAVPSAILLGAVAAGVGIFLMVGVLRILLGWPLKWVLLISYTLVFAISAIVAPEFLALSFDSGGVTTGPITVPFILAIGMGVATVRGGRSSGEDSFGLCAVCSVGPIIAVTLCGVFYNVSGGGEEEVVHAVSSWGELFGSTFGTLGHTFVEVAMMLLPIVIIFLLFQIFKVKMARSQLFRIFAGVFYTYVGLSLFIAGINVGFKQAGVYLGEQLGSLGTLLGADGWVWLAVPVSAVIGFFVVRAEPAVHVLSRQVSELTSGAIPEKIMLGGMSAGVSIALSLATVRMITHTNIWFYLLPAYALAIGLSFFSPQIFTAVAFDAGGVAAGAMASAFVLPFATGICMALGGNVMTEAFGCIAFVAMMPIITVQSIGVIYKIMLARAQRAEDEED